MWSTFSSWWRLLWGRGGLCLCVDGQQILVLQSEVHGHDGLRGQQLRLQLHELLQKTPQHTTVSRGRAERPTRLSSRRQRYLHDVLRHSGHVLGQYDDHGPRRLSQCLLIFLIREIGEPHHHTSPAEHLGLHRTSLRVQNGATGTWGRIWIIIACIIHHEKPNWCNTALWS